jgi:hypothetical protein
MSAIIWEDRIPAPQCRGGPSLGNSGPPSALDRISNDQNVNVVFAGGPVE